MHAKQISWVPTWPSAQTSTMLCKIFLHLVPRVFVPLDQQSGKKWPWKLLIGNGSLKISNYTYHLDCPRLTLMTNTRLSGASQCFTSGHYHCSTTSQSQSCNRTLKSHLFYHPCAPRCKGWRYDIANFYFIEYLGSWGTRSSWGPPLATWTLWNIKHRIKDGKKYSKKGRY